nr:MAG TPA: hypothetical protein [Caudoviricetes sp.]DAZ74238.1 MAG TPA: hypothetical protein [Caudoviricetes sp.]
MYDSTCSITHIHMCICSKRIFLSYQSPCPFIAGCRSLYYNFNCLSNTSNYFTFILGTSFYSI